MSERLAFEPNWISAPGNTIADALEERGWSQLELAQRLSMSPKFVNQLVRGKATLSTDTAMLLATVLGSTPEFWLRLEANYRTGLARREQLEQLAPHVAWLDELPVAAMARLGWIAKLTRPVEKVAACLRFFGVASVEAWRETCERPLAAYRKSAKFEQKPGAVAAWLRQAEIQAGQVAVGRFQVEAFQRELRQLRVLTREPNPAVFVPELVKRCAAHGVAVVLVPAPDGCRASGATKWLGDKAVLALSLRHKTDDHLWFTFFHEAFHLILHGKRMLFIESLDGLDDAEEREADRAAADLLIPPELAAGLLGMPWKADLAEQVAERWGIAPGVVVGRLQHDGIWPRNVGNNLKVSYTWEGREHG